MQFTQALSLLFLSSVSLTGVMAAPTTSENLAPRMDEAIYQGVFLPFSLTQDIL